MRSLAVLVYGHNSAGKSTCARILASRLAGDVVEFGDLVRRGIRDDPRLPIDTCKAFEALRERHGPSLLADWALRRWADSATLRPLIMVGVRDRPSFDCLLQAFPDAIRIAVLSDAQLRYARSCSKQGSANIITPLTYEEFRRRDEHHKQWGLISLLEEAEFRIVNDGSLQKLACAAARIGGIIESQCRCQATPHQSIVAH